MSQPDNGIAKTRGFSYLIGQILVSGLTGAGIGWLLFYFFQIAGPVNGLSTLGWCAVLIGFPMFSFLMDASVKWEIKRFCKAHDLQVIHIKTFKNHFGVDYKVDGAPQYGKWPKDFEQYETRKPIEK